MPLHGASSMVSQSPAAGGIHLAHCTGGAGKGPQLGGVTELWAQASNIEVLRAHNTVLGPGA